MPRPVEPGGVYLPGLDGLRALAVLVVVAYHLGVPGFGGGLLGVGVFFTLSGFLITSILAGCFNREGRMDLGTFWLRRFRRLVPAMVVMLAAVLVATVMTGGERLGERLRESAAAMLYVANWVTIADGESYFERFEGPGPLDHLWSLSVEEQFYVLWPLVLLLLLSVLRLSLSRTAQVTLAMAAVSFVLLAVLAEPGFDHTRVYEGTDTRAGGLLLGAALALGWPRIQARLREQPERRVQAEIEGIFGLLGIAALVALTDEYSMSLYYGGLLLLSLCTLSVLVAVVQDGSRLGVVLGMPPLRWVGERSYGIYLWHLPVVVFAAGSVPPSPLRALLLVAVTLVLAEISWRFVEDPIRRRGFRAVLLPDREESVSRPGLATTAERSAAGLRALVLVTTVAALALAAGHQIVARPDPMTPAVAGGGLPPLPPPEDPFPAASTAGPRPEGRPGARPDARPDAGPSRRPQGARGRLTRCVADVHVGDSTSIGLMNRLYLPERADRLPAQLHRVGVRRVQTDISGARSIVETYKDRPNATEAVASRIKDGYVGCWTIAMGTNEAANQAVGGSYPFADRIDRMMRPIGDQPVLWLTVRSLLEDGPYADRGMEAFSEALVSACRRYPNLRVYDWRGEVRRDWFIPDGIHFTTEGYRERARRIADALAVAFPAGGEPARSCVVRSRG